MKEHYGHITCYLPSNLDLENDILQYNHRWRHKYIYFIHTLVFKALQSKQNFNGYINLNSIILKKMLGERFYQYIIQQLENSNIIEVNKKYSKGGFSKSYRLTKRFTKSKIISIELDKQTYCRKVSQYRTDSLREAIKMNPLIKHELLQLSYRMIDVNSAMEYISSKYDTSSHQYKSRLIAIEQFDLMHKTKFNGTLTNPIEYHFTYNKGRLYNPATSLPRDLERFTYFKGYESDESICFDMPNSQLCFFNEFAKRWMKTNSHHIGSIVTEEYRLISKNDNLLFSGESAHSTNINNHLDTVPYVLTFNSDFYFEEEIHTWQSYIFSGKGYELLMNYLNYPSEQRQEFKAKFFGELFYNRWQPKHSEMEEAFIKLYEVDAILLRAIKRKLGNSQLAINVQRLEAQVFHSMIVEHMKTNHKNIPFTIKHDSITLPSSAGAYIYEELNQMVREFFKVESLNLSIETL